MINFLKLLFFNYFFFAYRWVQLKQNMNSRKNILQIRKVSLANAELQCFI